MNFDSDQQAAYAADRNAAVSAGAGSGKTTVLSERYVRLVTERAFRVSEVLTLTFTRKAASEMRERIFRRLSASTHPLAKDALSQFDQARIATLDSFCSTLVRGASYRYGIPGDFRVDDASLRRMAEESAVELIMREREQPALSCLVSARSFETVVKDLFAGIAADDFSLVSPRSYKALAEKQRRFIEAETEKCAGALNECCETILAIDDSKSSSATLKKAKAAARNALPFPLHFDDEEIKALVQSAAFFSSKESFTLPASSAKDEALVELRESALVLKENAKRLQTLAKTLQFREDIGAIGALLDEYAKIFLERKRQMGLLSFRDTLEMAVDMLRSDLGLRSYYKRHIKAIMIDEFQDNNEMQKRLLYLLAERDDAGDAGVLPSATDLAPDKLFFVGDEKQSIYRFRGADVAVFRGLSDELAEGAGISLGTNYRSSPELVAFFNRVFPAVFGEAEHPFDAAFSPIKSDPRKAALSIAPSPPVEITLQEGGDKGDEDDSISPAASEALAAAERIISGVENGEFRFGEAALLFKKTSHQNEYERVFREAGIPFTAADPRGVYAEGPANDLYAILRLSLFPLDRNAYATVLRSPFVRLDDECVFKILLENPDDPFCKGGIDALSAFPTEKRRYEHGRRLFTSLKARIDRESLASILTFLWYESGYRTWMLYHKDSRPNLVHFEYLYTLALNADQRQLSLSAFLDEIAEFIGTTEKTETGEAPEVNDEVLFLTVHKSKGLEFKVVILADAGGVGQGDQNNKPYYMAGEWGPVVNLKLDTSKRDESPVNYFYDAIKADIQQQEEAELKRLFYVAATRAEARLFMFGTRRITKADEGHFLQGLDAQERLEALIKTPRQNAHGAVQKKSFLDLLALGLASEREDGAAGEYALFALETPSRAEYRERIQGANERSAALRTKKAPKTRALAPASFYAQELPVLPPPVLLHTTPSEIERSGAFARPSGLSGHLPALPPFICAVLIGKSAEGPQNFGILCHRLIAALFDDPDSPKLVREKAARESRMLFPDCGSRGCAAIAEEALELSRRFLVSDLGREAASSETRRSECSFLLPLAASDAAGAAHTVLVSGVIDLIYEYEGCCVIVDFKTDAHVRPEAHRLQLACYEAAASAFSPLPPRLELVYLRNMEVRHAPNTVARDLLAAIACDAALSKRA